MKKITRKKGTTLFQLWLTPEEKSILRSTADKFETTMSDLMRSFIHSLAVGYENNLEAEHVEQFEDVE